MDHWTFALGLAAGALLIWAVVATIVAIQQHRDSGANYTSLRAAYAGLDNCLSYCGGAGNWAPGQVTQASAIISSILSSQSKISCSNPSTGYPALTQCAIGNLSASQPFWTIVDPGNAATSSSLITTALTQCVSSGQVSGCKIGS
jgi:hypothetical protein